MIYLLVMVIKMRVIPVSNKCFISTAQAIFHLKKAFIRYLFASVCIFLKIDINLTLPLE